MSDSQAPDDPPDPFDTNKPSVARAYDYALGGKDNFEADRRFADAVAKRDPDVWTTAKLNREFGRRVTEYLARQGVRQYLDLGSGIPTSPPSIHEAARDVVHESRVIYVDHDPVVVAHNQALRAVGPGLAVVQESFLNIDAIFAHKDFVANIDVNEPIAVSLYSVLQNTTDDVVAETLAKLRSRLAPGSFLAISHICDRTEQHVQDAFHQQTEYGYPWVWFRSDAQVKEFFTGLDLVPPGISDYRDWHPTAELVSNRPALSTHFTCGVGIVPR